MKNIFTLVLVALLGLNVSAQDSKKVTMKITYKGNPLCYWDVTLKHGDVAIGQGKTDDKGFVDFGYVRLLSNQVDASGYKKTNNGDKSWDVKGYINLNEQGHADFDFDPLVQEMGMPGMLESAWGLTLNDCVASSSSNSSNNNSSTQNTTSTDNSSTTNTTDNSTTANSTTSTPEPLVVDPAQGYANQKALYENQIAGLNRKIEKKKEEQAKLTPETKEYNELTYDIMELELERDLTQVKLEKTEKSIANGNTPLNKTDRDYYNQKEEEIKTKQETLKENRKKGLSPTGEEADVDEDEIEGFEIYTPEQLAEMGTPGLQKLKLEYQTKLTKRNTILKTRGASLKPDKRTQLENEVLELERMIKLCDEEITKRKEQK